MLCSEGHWGTLTFSARPSLALHCSVLNSSSCFLAIHSSYLAWSDAMPSSTSASRALASARIRWVSCSSSVACFKAAFRQGESSKVKPWLTMNCVNWRSISTSLLRVVLIHELWVIIKLLWTMLLSKGWRSHTHSDWTAYIFRNCDKTKQQKNTWRSEELKRVCSKLRSFINSPVSVLQPWPQSDICA